MKSGSGWILAAVVAALSPSPCATADGTGWDAYYNGGLSALKAGDHAKAADLMKQAVAAAEKLGPENTETSRALAGLADVYLAQERTTEAGLLLERSLYILAKAPRATASDLARVQESLGRVRTSQKRYAEAESLLKQVLTFREKTLGPDSAGVVEILEMLTVTSRKQGDYSESAAWRRRTFEIRVRAAKNSPQKLVEALLERADFETFCDNKAGARTLWERALAVQEKWLGVDHPDVATTLMKVASDRIHMTDEGTLAVSLSDVPNPPNFPTNWENVVKISTGFFRETEPLVKRALAIREKALGVEHPDTLEAVEYLAAGYELVGDKARTSPSRNGLRRPERKRKKERSAPDQVYPASGLSNLPLCFDCNEKRISCALALGYRLSSTIRRRLAIGFPQCKVAQDGRVGKVGCFWLR